MTHRTSILLVSTWIVSILSVPASFAVESLSRDFQVRPLDRIEAGTVIDPEGTSDWSDLLVFVNGSLGRGDVDAASATVRRYASLFNLVYMANVKETADGRFVLDKVGVGFSTKIDGRDVIITGETHKKQGASLGMIGGAVFAANERALDEIVQVARYRDGMFFDAPTIMLRDGVHKKVIVRFFVWVSPKGKVGTVCWVLDGYGGSRYEAVDRTVVLLPPRLIENRIMHVDGDRFTFGIPSEDAFAMVSLPAGRRFRIDEGLNELLSVRSYDQQTFFEAIRKLSTSLASQ